jgi:hypothetical protein
MTRLDSFGAAVLLALLLPVLPGVAQHAPKVLFVGNQGNFSDANGTVSVVDLATYTATNDAVPGLHTLVQSLSVYEGTGYVVANTSDRIDRFSVETFDRTGQILGVPSPRYLRMVGPDKAYVSNLYDRTVTILRLSEGSVRGTIAVGDNPEAIAWAAGRVYVANHGFGEGTTLTVIDPSLDLPIGTIDLPCDGPRMLETDAEEDLWVACTGKTVYNDDFTEIIEQTTGRILVLDGATGDVRAAFESPAQLGSGVGGQDAFYDPVGRRFYVIEDRSLLVFDTSSNAALPSVVISGDEPILAVAFDASRDQFFLGRLTSYTEAGFVSIHDTLGLEVDRVPVGIAPSSLVFAPGLAAVAIETPEAERTDVLRVFPQPAREVVRVVFELPIASSVRLGIFDALGRSVATLAESTFPAGRHEMAWYPGAAPAGTYVVRLEAGDTVAHQSILRVK